MPIHDLIQRFRIRLAHRRYLAASLYAMDLTDDDRAYIERYAGRFTMTSPNRLLALREAVRYIVRARISGDIVECGVWRGGSLMAAAETLLALADTTRTLWGYDTFTGMPEPGEERDAFGVSARTYAQRHGTGGPGWQAASEAQVAANLARTGYPRVRLVPGKVEDTIPKDSPTQIAVLRLDTDWYDSTKHSLEHLYPRLASGGVLLLDDYGYWSGQRRAVDEYFCDAPLLLARIEPQARMAVKP